MPRRRIVRGQRRIRHFGAWRSRVVRVLEGPAWAPVVARCVTAIRSSRRVGTGARVEVRISQGDAWHVAPGLPDVAVERTTARVRYGGVEIGSIQFDVALEDRALVWVHTESREEWVCEVLGGGRSSRPAA